MQSASPNSLCFRYPFCLRRAPRVDFCLVGGYEYKAGHSVRFRIPSTPSRGEGGKTVKVWPITSFGSELSQPEVFCSEYSISVQFKNYQL